MTIAAPWGLRWRSRTSFIILTVALGLFTDLFLYSLPVPLLPYILQDRLHRPAEDVQKYSSILLAAHAISSAMFCPVVGVFLEKSSRRKAPYLASVLILLLSTVLSFLGNNMVTLALARVLQGAAGAVVWTVSQALLIDTVGARNVGKVTGSIYGIISIGVLVAPVLGGVLYHETGVGGPLALGCSLLGADLTTRLLMIEKKVAAEYGSCHVYSTAPFPSPEGTNEEETADPLIKAQRNPAHVIQSEHSQIITSYPILYCFRDARMLTASWITLTQATLLGSLDAMIPVIGEAYYQFNSLQTGLLFVPIVLPMLLLGPVAGWIVDRHGSRAIVVSGFGFLVPIFIFLRWVQTKGSVHSPVYCTVLTLCGVCLAATNPSALVESTLVVEKYHRANPGMFGPNGPYAQISSITGLLYNAGTALGPLLASILKDAAGYGDMNLFIATLSFVTAVLALLYMGEGSTDASE